MFTNSNIKVNRDLCLACGECVDRCIMDNLRLSVAPCRQHCPLVINCQGYARLIAQGKNAEAAAHLRKDTPFGALLGRVCHHPCESHCERDLGGGDGAVHLRALKLFLAETFPEAVNAPGQCATSTGHSVGIVGSGPAGLGAAYELALQGHAVTVYEAAPQIGGLLRYAIPAYRLPDTVLDAQRDQLETMGIIFRTGTALGTQVKLEDLRKTHQAVLLAVGLGQSVVLPAVGTGADAVRSALDVLSALRTGEGAEPLRAIRRAVVVGGGNTALDTALSLKKAGVDTVTIVSLEGPHELPVHPAELQEVMDAGVNFMHRWGVQSVQTSGSHYKLLLTACVTPFDADGHFAPVMDSSLTHDFEADIVISAVGQKVDSKLLSDLGLEQKPLPLRVFEGDKSSGAVFASGDCVSGASSVVNALAAGKHAAEIINAHLSDEQACEGRTRFDSYWDAHGMTRTYEAPHDKAVGGPRTPRPCAVAARGLNDVVETVMTAEQAKGQAERCLACGRAFEANFTCWFCLPCEIDCPAEALSVQMPYQVR